MRSIRWVLAASVAGLVSLPPSAIAHWPDQPPRQVAELGEFHFEGGGVIPNLQMTYVTHGKLNAAKDNAILFMHGLAANHHAADHMIGPGRAFDTDRYFVICSDALGATQTTYAHSSSPTSSGLKMKFPFYNGRDMVRAQYRLVTEALAIPHLLAVSGISSGGRDSIQFAVSYPDFMDAIVPVVAGTRLTTMARLYGPLMVALIESCDGWNGGDYEENPKGCATNAMSVLVLNLYTRTWWEQYVDTPEGYTKWRNQWGDYYLDVQDARDLYYRLKAGGRGWIGDTPGFDGDAAAALRSIKAKALFIANPQDQLLPPEHVEAVVETIPNARAAWIDSPAGHLICCNADPNATRDMGSGIKQFLRELSSREASSERKH